ncbi:MAG TPA: glycosyltransferase family 39 protein [Polyangiaceae bacterium]|nr:glycosyltransferase family 39 protein [Polyangiaceae bacterium]
MATGIQRLTAGFGLRQALIVGLALRIVWIAACPNQPTSDQIIYHDSARWLAQGLGYVDELGRAASFWPVGYAALLWPFYAAFGPHVLVAQLVNVLLGLATIYLLYATTRALFGEGAGRAAAWLWAVLPTSIAYTTCVASENAMLPGLLGAVWIMLEAPERPHPALFDALAGVVLAATGYVRGTALLFASLPLILSFRQPLVAVRRTVVVGGCMVLLLLPWGFRNQHEFGSFTITSINAGANLWMGNHPGTTGMAASVPPEYLRLPLAQMDAELGKVAREYIKADPVRFVRLAARRTWLTLRSDTIAGTWNEPGLKARYGPGAVKVAKIACSLGYYALSVFAAAAVWLRARRKSLGKPDLVLAYACGLVALPFVVIVGGNRYMLPAQPFLAAWAGFWLAATFAVFGAAPQRRESGDGVLEEKANAK